MEQLRSRLATLQADLKASSNKICVFSETGPVGIGIIKEIVRVLDDQEKRIAALDGKAGADTPLRAKGIRVIALAKELGVNSSDILERLRSAGLGDKATSPQSTLKGWVPEMIRESFKAKCP